MSHQTHSCGEWFPKLTSHFLSKFQCCLRSCLRKSNECFFPACCATFRPISVARVFWHLGFKYLNIERTKMIHVRQSTVFRQLLVSAFSAAFYASVTDAAIWDTARVSTHVTSQTRYFCYFPSCQGIIVIPSCHLSTIKPIEDQSVCHDS